MGKQIHTDLDFQGGAKITGLPASAANGQPVVHEQLQGAIEGLKWKDPVRVAAPGNINLAAPGSAIDGVTLSNNDRFIAPNQTDMGDAGIYIFNGAAVAATRAADASTMAEMANALIPITEGTSAGVTLRQTVMTGTLGTTDLAFTAFGTATPSASDTVAGKVELATTAETTAGTDTTRAVTPAGLAGSVHAKKKYAADFGDNSATQFDFTHNFGTLDVVARAVLKSTGEDIECAIKRTDTNTVRVNVVAAPATNAMRIIIIG